MSSDSSDSGVIAEAPAVVPLPVEREGARWTLWKASTVAFVASGCTLVLELVAGRLMAPWIGVNLYTWTSIIGVVLAGIALGNYLGGRVADRRASDRVLGVILLVGAVAALTILPLVNLVLRSVIEWPIPIFAQNLVATSFLFFVPSLVLGMVSPVVIKLTLADLGETGSVVGKIYAWSTAGSIVGTFLTGFVLVATFGTRSIVFGVAIVLLALSVYAGRLYRRPIVVAVLLALLVGSWFGIRRVDALSSPCSEETQYYCIVWYPQANNPDVRVLALDHMVQSYNHMKDPLELGYGYEKVYAEVILPHIRRLTAPRSLFIGGGGFTFPRWMQVMRPEGRSDVLEIDPEVFKTAYQNLGIDPALAISTYTVDARLFLNRNNPQGEYDLVFGDAFHNFAVPYHLTTLEFNQLVKTALKPGGVYIMNLIDIFKGGEFLRAYIRTARQTFEYVYLFTEGELDPDRGRNTFVIVSTDQPLDLDSIAPMTRSILGRLSVAQLYPPELLDQYLTEGRDFLLTDDYVPVDNLLEPLLRGD